MKSLAANSATVDHYVRRIYQATLEPNLIHGLIDDLRQTLDAPYGAFQVENKLTYNLESGVLLNYDQKAIDEYARYYVELDPWTRAGFHKIVNRFCAGHKLVSDNEYCRSEFYQDWGRINDVRHVIGSGFNMENDSLFKVSFQRHSDHAEFDQDVEDFLNILQPHLAHFVRLAPLFEEQTSNANLWLSTLDSMARPIWILDSNLRIVYRNHCAEEWMNCGSIVTSKENILLTANKQQQKTLHHLVRHTAHVLQACNTNKMMQKSYWHHHRIVLESQHGQLENFWLSPFANQELLGSDGLVLMTGRKSVPNTDQLTHSYGLTNRQAQLCALLMEGRALPEASQHLNISINTVRNILAACFNKLGVKNQSELIQLLFNGL